MQVGEPVKVICGLENGSIGTISEITENAVLVKFPDFEYAQPYYKWELSQNGVFPPYNDPI